VLFFHLVYFHSSVQLFKSCDFFQTSHSDLTWSGYAVSHTVDSIIVVISYVVQ